MTPVRLALIVTVLYAVTILGVGCRAHRSSSPLFALALAAVLGPAVVAAHGPVPTWGAVLAQWPRAVLLSAALSVLPLLMLTWQTLADRGARPDAAPAPDPTDPT